MSEEEVLYEEGDALARLAVENDLASKQLRALYTLSVSSPSPYLKAVVRGQIGRRIRGFYGPFGDRILSLIEKYPDKRSFSRILEYADMLYDYYKEMARMPVTNEEIMPVIQPILKEYGLQGVRIVPEREGTMIHIKLKTYPRDRATLVSKINREIREKVPRLRMSRFRVWIE